ncbi:hypothetical protein H4W33_007305 [Kibdelosporangium phytohabitans]|uniref:hypothetical protein n=1 Tax=Kibdelosporangium phytohabitans TaxID=860235 RepID=UPI00147065B0|nr:hypothetical protein [Kibdelosporangium phytohabitans]MBE1468293.1 hypothetical protein [Kibdelosporangium phytohabitans]
MVTIVIALVVLCAGALVTLRLVEVNTDAGVEPAGGRPAKECAVNSEALDAAKVGVYSGGSQNETSVKCDYGTRKGTDGATLTTAIIEVKPVKRDSATPDPDTAFDDFARPPSSGSPQVLDDPRFKFGNQRKLYQTQYGELTMLMLYVRTGSTLYRIEYTSSTKGFFSDSPTPADKMKPGLETLARDMDKRARR